MARESELWKRLRDAAIELRARGHLIDLQRIENDAGVGHPDTEGCVNGAQVWIELKSCSRPKRPTTPVRPEVRTSQSIWHKTRTEAGGRYHWVLIQVGEAHNARLYLIPGKDYDRVVCPEAELAAMSVIASDLGADQMIIRAAIGWSTADWLN